MSEAEAIGHIFSREYSLCQRIPRIASVAITEMEDGRMNRSFLKTLTAALSLALTACNSGGSYTSTTGSAFASAGSDDGDTIILRAASDGAKTTIVIPDKPNGKANDPDGIYENIASMAFSLEDQGVKDLIENTANGSGVSDNFQRIMTKIVRGDGLGGAGEEGALVMAVWYKRGHPDLNLHDATVELFKNLPSVETFKTAVVVFNNILTDIGTKNSANNVSSADELTAGNAPQSAVTHDTPASVSQAPRDATTHGRAVRAPDTGRFAGEDVPCIVYDNVDGRDVRAPLDEKMDDGLTVREVEADCRARLAHPKEAEKACLAAGLEKDCDGL